MKINSLEVRKYDGLQQTYIRIEIDGLINNDANFISALVSVLNKFEEKSKENDN